MLDLLLFVISTICLVLNSSQTLSLTPRSTVCPLKKKKSYHFVKVYHEVTTYIMWCGNSLGVLKCCLLIWKFIPLKFCSWSSLPIGSYFTSNTVVLDWHNIYILYWSDFVPSPISTTGLIKTFTYLRYSDFCFFTMYSWHENNMDTPILF